jgi:hypothetical protein
MQETPVLEKVGRKMKIRIDLSDEAIERMDSLAGRLGMSRDDVITLALAEFVAKHDDRRVTEKLDRIYGDDGRPDPFVRRAAARALARNPWTVDR